MNNRWPYSSPGLPDNLFQRAPGVPMTKQEIRAVSISQLRVFPGAVVCDVGAGTGSVGLECALLGCKVFSVEKDPTALQVLAENIRLFELENVQIIAGPAPDVLWELSPVDRFFLGGSGGNLDEILEVINYKLKPGGRLVVNSVTVDTGPSVINFMKKNNYTDLSIASINVSRAVSRGRVQLWQALNPVQIISGQKGEI